jgi:glycosyltransferase involved in cell wall biosynthesis
MAGAFPGADLWALSDAMGADFDAGGRPVRTTFFDRSTTLSERRELSLPLMPLAWRTVDAPNYEVVLSSSHACAKGFRPGRDALHLCYCYTPMRYVWDAHDRRHAVQRVADLGPRQALRRWDRRSARWVDSFAAISSEVAQRIERSYGRQSRIIFPPVDTEYFTPGAVDPDSVPLGPFVLACSRFVPYKRLDVAIEAAALAGLPLVIAGRGPDEARLRTLAAASGGEVRFEVSPSDERLRELYRAAAAFVFPAFEDFGIVAVEAQACGTPVVALARGGAVDTVIDQTTGVLVREETPEAFAAALQVVVDADLGAAAAAEASRFSLATFQRELRSWVRDAQGEGAHPTAPTTIVSVRSQAPAAG